MADTKTNKKIAKPEGEEEAFEKTVVTSIEKVDLPRDEKAYILFISGPLIGKMYLLESEETVIGRSEDVDISIADTRVSRHHLRLIVEGGQVWSAKNEGPAGARLARACLRHAAPLRQQPDCTLPMLAGTPNAHLQYVLVAAGLLLAALLLAARRRCVLAGAALGVRSRGRLLAAAAGRRRRRVAVAVLGSALLPQQHRGHHRPQVD